MLALKSNKSPCLIVIRPPEFANRGIIDHKPPISETTYKPFYKYDYANQGVLNVALTAGKKPPPFLPLACFTSEKFSVPPSLYDRHRMASHTLYRAGAKPSNTRHAPSHVQPCNHLASRNVLLLASMYLASKRENSEAINNNGRLSWSRVLECPLGVSRCEKGLSIISLNFFLVLFLVRAMCLLVFFPHLVAVHIACLPRAALDSFSSLSLSFSF